MTWYEFFKVTHVSAAVIWVGGALMLQWFEARERRRRPHDVDQQLLDAEFFGTRVFIPASLLVLGSGLGMAAQRSWHFEFFMLFGLIVLALAFLTGAGFLGPQATRIRRELAQGATAATESRLRRFRLVSTFEDYMLLVVVIVMVVRPGS